MKSVLFPLQRFRHGSVLALVVVWALAGCAGVAAPDAAVTPTVRSAWVELTPQPQVRAIVSAGSACPDMWVEGHTHAMRLRVKAGSPPLRSPGSQPSKQPVFDVDVCEGDYPAGSGEVRVGRFVLPPLVAAPTRIVVLGDTGCRITVSASQPCNDPRGWPFASVAASAARAAPELVIHVGDYHYREAPCAGPQAGCEGSPWGYGWDAWDADFFAPAEPLLTAAPWVFVRGNHEECARAGQGWFRFLAPERYTAARSCDDPANDDLADFSEPYSVPIAADAQLVVFDSARAGNMPLRPGNPRDTVAASKFRSQLQLVGALATRRPTWFASHHPVLAFAPDGRSPGAAPFTGNPALQVLLRELFGAAYLPAHVELALHGHVHLFQAIEFESGQPATIVAGHGGDNVDVDLPVEALAHAVPASGAHIARMSHSSGFGFLVLQRDSPTSNEWAIFAHRADGTLLTTCSLTPPALRCHPSGLLR